MYLQGLEIILHSPQIKIGDIIMTILEIFEKVNIKTPVEQRIFFNYLDDSINEIGGLYGDVPQLVFNHNIKSADIVPTDSLDGYTVILPLYHNAIVDNILFLCGQGEDHKGEFIRKAKEAYLHYWNLYSKGKRIRGRRW